MVTSKAVPLTGVENSRLSLSSTPEAYILQSSALLTVEARSMVTVVSVFSVTSRSTVSYDTDP